MFIVFYLCWSVECWFCFCRNGGGPLRTFPDQAYFPVPYVVSVMMWSSLTLLLDPVMDIGSVEFNMCYYEYLAYPRGDTTPLVCVVVMVIKLSDSVFNNHHHKQLCQ